MTCSKCNSESLFKQGTKKETGKPWSGYFCQNPECKNVDWTPKSPKGTSPQPPQSPINNENTRSGEILILDKLDALDARFNDLAVYLKSKLG